MNVCYVCDKGNFAGETGPEIRPRLNNLKKTSTYKSNQPIAHFSKDNVKYGLRIPSSNSQNSRRKTKRNFNTKFNTHNLELNKDLGIPNYCTFYKNNNYNIFIFIFNLIFFLDNAGKNLTIFEYMLIYCYVNVHYYFMILYIDVSSLYTFLKSDIH